jgi:uncharacterized protein
MDYKFWELFLSRPLMAALIAQLSSQVFKVFLPLFEGKPPDIRKFADYGGIPSAHTAFLVGVTIGIGLKDGWGSSLFAIASVIAAILIYDIIKMRKAIEVNLHMTKKLMELHKLPIEEKIPQFKGHSIVEVAVGGIWGALCAIIVSLF